MKVPAKPADDSKFRSAYALGDPLRGVFRAVGDPIAAAMGRKTTLGYPSAGSTRASFSAGLDLLGTVALPGPSTIRLGKTSTESEAASATGALIGALAPGRGGLLDLGDAAAGGEQTFLARQVTLTDFCYPEAECLGSMILSMRHPLDVNSAAVASTPAGRDPRAVEAAWYELSEMAAVAVNHPDGQGGVRPSLVSLAFLVASRASEYADRSAADAVRTHVISNYGCRRAADRLDRFGACLLAMVRCRVFPHRIFGALGGLVSCVSQREIASVTVVVRGPQEGVKTETTSAPRSAVTVPACAYLDLDKELRIRKDDRCATILYLAFVYSQRNGREGARVHVVRSALNEDSLCEGLGHMYDRLRTANAMHGTEGATVPRPQQGAAFPLLRLFGDRNAPRCPIAHLTSRGATARLHEWTPDLRGRVSPDSCMYAAYCRIGYMDDLSTCVQRRNERFGSVDVPVTQLHGVTWSVGEWRECYL
uniref:Capsid shell protein VP19C n=1 Tax=Anatid alphaherpesvirus 2 TaxID=3080522 RepID=A0AAU0K6S7_9ALPH